MVGVSLNAPSDCLVDIPLRVVMMIIDDRSLIIDIEIWEKARVEVVNRLILASV
jgi:hypothetical protein